MLHLAVMIGGDDLSADVAQGVEWGAQLPRVLLLHGTGDTCALFSNATQFRDALQEVGAKVMTLLCNLVCYPQPHSWRGQRPGHKPQTCCLLLLCKAEPGKGSLKMKLGS